MLIDITGEYSYMVGTQIDVPMEQLEQIGIMYKFDTINKKIVPCDKEYIKRQLLSNEVLAIKEWFDRQYSYKEQKFRRLIELGIKCDDGTDPKDRLTELYKEAETNRKRIQELEQELGVNNGSNNN